jgi:uncharacterized protein YggT (Ycf19 family)
LTWLFLKLLLLTVTIYPSELIAALLALWVQQARLVAPQAQLVLQAHKVLV